MKKLKEKSKKLWKSTMAKFHKRRKSKNNW